jgi:serine/threonine protein kinase
MSDNNINEIKRLFEKKYNCIIKEKIAEGGYGKVYLGYLKNKIKVAIKIMIVEKNDQYKNKKTIDECYMAKSFKAFHIIYTFSITQDNLKDYNIYSIKMEYAGFGNLGFFLNYLYNKNLLRLSVNNKYFWISHPNTFLIIFFIEQIIKILQLLFISNIVHFDIKLENFLLCDDFFLKLCDFSLTKQLNKKNSKIKFHSSTWCYQAPIFYKEEKIISFNDSFKLDYFSVGMIIYYMVFKKHLFPKEHQKIINYQICIEDIDNGINKIDEAVKYYNIEKDLSLIMKKLIKKEVHDISNINEFVDNEWLFKENKLVHKIKLYNQFLEKKFLIEMYKYDRNIIRKRKKYVL